MITTDDVKKLREETGVSVMQCKKALEEAGGDMAKAKVILQKKGGAIAAKKADRALGAGVVQAYVHSTNTVAGIVVLSCETDFVAKNEEFVKLAYDIAMQVAATAPEFMKRDDVDEKAMKAAKEVFTKEIEGKPKDLKEKILEGKLDAYFKDRILLEQAYIKDDSKTVQGLIDEATQKFGERIELTRFERFSVQG
jgi:elongation factor Ts